MTDRRHASASPPPAAAASPVAAVAAASSPLSSPTATASAAMVEPLLLHSGWVTKLKSGLLSSADRRMFARLTLGLSPSQPASWSCFDSDAPGASRLKHALCDGSVALKADTQKNQLSITSRAQPASALSALSASHAPSMQQALVGIHWIFDAGRDVRAWADAFEQVTLQTRGWEEAAAAERKRASVAEGKAAAAQAHQRLKAKSMVAPTAQAVVTSRAPSPAPAPAPTLARAPSPAPAIAPAPAPAAVAQSPLSVDIKPAASAPADRPIHTPVPVAASFGEGNAPSAISPSPAVGNSSSGEAAAFSVDVSSPSSSPQHRVPASDTSRSASVSDSDTARLQLPFDYDRCQTIPAVSPLRHHELSPAHHSSDSFSSLVLPSPAAVPAHHPSPSLSGMGSFGPDGDFLPQQPAEGAIASLLAEAAETVEAHAGLSSTRHDSTASDHPRSEQRAVSPSHLPSTPSANSVSSPDPPQFDANQVSTPVSAASAFFSDHHQQGPLISSVDESSSASLSELKDYPPPSGDESKSQPRALSEANVQSSSSSGSSSVSLRAPTADYSGMGSSLPFEEIATAHGSPKHNGSYSALGPPASPLSASAAATEAALRSASPVVSTHQHPPFQHSQSMSSLRSSGSGSSSAAASGDFTSASSHLVGAVVDGRPLNAAAAAAFAAAAADAARKKEALRIKAAEKKAADAKQLRLMKNRMFQKLFSLPPTEELLEDYSAAIRKAILLHGRLYLSWNYLCFFSSIFSHKTSLVLPVSDILWVCPASVALLFDNSIKVYVQTGPLPVPKIHPVTGAVVPLPGAIALPAPVLASATPITAAVPPTTATDAKGEKSSSASGTASPAQQSINEKASISGVTSPAPESSQPVDAAATSASVSSLLASSHPSAFTPAAAHSTENAEATTTSSQDSAATPASAAELLSSAAPASSSGAASSSVASSTTSTAAPSGLQSPTPPLPPAPAPMDPLILAASLVYPDPLPTTSNASMELTDQQLAYLIAINHPNITTHFFASFLMRDHALALMEGLLKKRREMNPAWVAMNTAWKQAESLRAQAAAQAAAAEAALAAAAEMRTPPMTPSSKGAGGGSPSSAQQRARSSTLSSLDGAGETHSLRSLPGSPSNGEGVGGYFPSSTPTHSHHLSPSPLREGYVDERKSSGGGASSAASSSAAGDGSSTAAASAAAVASLPPLTVVPRFSFPADALVPEDDFTKMEWDDLLDATLGGLGARAFFAAFLGDGAVFSTASYAQSAATGRGDTEWKISSWHVLGGAGEPVQSLGLPIPPQARTGPWVRDSSYIKQIKDSPLGPPSTRVHQSAVYTSPSPASVQLQTRTLTPDVPFGDNLYVLERLTLEDAGSASSPAVRIRVWVGVRFLKTPWKMKPFVGLIRSKTKEDVGRWYKEWVGQIRAVQAAQPEVIRAAVRRELGADAVVAVGAGATAVPATAGTASEQAASAAAAPAASAASVSEPSAAASSPASPGVSAAPVELDSAQPLSEWVWLRRSVSSVPMVNAHTDAVMANVGRARATVRAVGGAEIVCVLLLWCTCVSLLSGWHDVAWSDVLLTMLLPWRWLSALTHAPPALPLAGALVCVLMAQRRQMEQTQTALQRISDARRADQQQMQRMQQQINDLAQGRGGPGGILKVDERHFK